MTTFFLTFIFISLLILVHEAGHFFTARMFGITVEEFGFGFPPRITSWVKNGIRYSINLLPFGGFVKIYGEQGEGEGDRKSFISRPPWQRFIVLFAGIAMNFVLAWVFFSISSFVGVPHEAAPGEQAPVSVVEISPNSPAEHAGIRFGDSILELRARGLNLRIESEDDVQQFLAAYRGEPVTFVVRRGAEVKEISVIPRVNPPVGEGATGIAMARIRTEPLVWYQAPWVGLVTLLKTMQLTLVGFGTLVHDIFVNGRPPAEITGPVGIFRFAQDTRSLGYAYFLQFIGILSVNLAILNVLPIPALDGGRIFFLLIEKIRGKRISVKVESITHAIGFVVLLSLMALVTYHDIARFF